MHPRLSLVLLGLVAACHQSVTRPAGLKVEAQRG
jgi:hypothetical protein